MKDQQFGQKAQKLYHRLTSITSETKKQTLAQTLNSSMMRNSTKYSQTIHQLMKFQQDILYDEEHNSHKIKQLNQELQKLQQHINRQNESRIKINENFIHSVLRVQNSVQTGIQNVKKVYLEREKKMEDRIQQMIKTQKKIIEEQFQQHNNIQNQINQINLNIKNLREDITIMRKNRLQLQDKIYKQFSDQIAQLKLIFQRTNKERQHKQNQLLTNLKNIYKQTMESVKTEQNNRQMNEKMFLTIIEQLIDRISQA